MAQSKDEEALLSLMRSMKLTPAQVMQKIMAVKTTGSSTDGTAPVEANSNARAEATACAKMIAQEHC